MNHYQAGATTGSNGVLKNYMLAVLVGVLLGGAYAGDGIAVWKPVRGYCRRSGRWRIICVWRKRMESAMTAATSIVNRGMAAEPARTWTI